ncbi:hypothetical protein PHMEG_00029184 [Phytophthora megakarya]|uniref:Uncharacterized protein n=1 Tax=Phytophthora megakarya TaxID=4795 RepID=A0A225V3A8_9STRA|nr:hypothetical protein PHMEG_00029184 [Phytophthora megakarya]
MQINFFVAVILAVLGVLGLVAAADQPHIHTAAEALEKMEASALPDGVVMVGTAERIEPPADIAATIAKETGENKDNKQEQYGWGGGWGGWGGWGGYGPYRFGFTCGGMSGWAYPMGYWNLCGAGMYGGSCGLRMAYGGLYYC